MSYTDFAGQRKSSQILMLWMKHHGPLPMLEHLQNFDHLVAETVAASAGTGASPDRMNPHLAWRVISFVCTLLETTTNHVP